MSINGGIAYGVNQNDYSESQVDTLITTAYETILLNEKINVDISERLTVLNDLMKIYDDIKYYRLKEDLLMANMMEKYLIKDLIQFIGVEHELYKINSNQYEQYKTDILNKTIIIDFLYILLLASVWSLISRIYGGYLRDTEVDLTN